MTMLNDQGLRDVLIGSRQAFLDNCELREAA